MKKSADLKYLWERDGKSTKEQDQQDDGSIASVAERKGSPSPCQQADSSQGRGAETMEPELTLPEDILYKIHALLPMRDAARAACLSRGFLHSWRCYPNLIFDMRALGKAEDACKKDETRADAARRVNHVMPNKEDQTRDFINRVDHIMQNHSGIGVKTFKLQTHTNFNVHPSYLDCWLQLAITPGIKEFELLLPVNKKEYNFPGSLLSCKRAKSIQSFDLTGCAFHSVDEVGCLSSLTTVNLCDVHITGEELCLFLSNSFALERLDLTYCDDISCLKIPSPLSKLNFLRVQCCKRLQTIEGNAPNLTKFNYEGPPIHISLGDSLQLKKIQMSSTRSNMLYYASTKLPSIAPNLRTLFLSSCDEKVNTPMVLGKFPHLKYLEIVLLTPSSPDYDFYSLVSFLDASPALKKFILRVKMPTIRRDSILGAYHGDSSLARCLPKHRHDKLKSVMITGFFSSKTMIELTSHILENAMSLKFLTLDTTCGYHRIFGDTCLPLSKEALMEARKALLVIRTYIEEKVPSKINFKVIEPCNKCHTDESCR